MALSPSQIKAAKKREEEKLERKVSIIHQLLAQICDQYTIEGSSIVHMTCKPEFAKTTREMLETINGAKFPADTINKIANKFWECVCVDMTIDGWMSDVMQINRRDLFIHLLGMEFNADEDDYQVRKEISILNTNNKIMIK